MKLFPCVDIALASLTYDSQGNILMVYIGLQTMKETTQINPLYSEELMENPR